MSDAHTIPTPAPADLPTLKILVGGAQVSNEYQVRTVVVARSYNRIATADILIYDGDPARGELKLSSSDDFVPGKQVEVRAGYHGSDELIFSGIIVRHGLRVYQERPSLLRIECRDAAVKLTVGRKSAYFYDSTDAEVIEEIAATARIATEIEATSVSHAQMVQHDATDWDFIVSRAEANGRLVVTDNGKLVVKAPDKDGEPVLSLTYGGNLLDMEAVIDARDQYSGVAAMSWDAVAQELLRIEGADPAAVAPGNLGGDELSAVIGLDSLEIRHSGQLKDDELQAWADARRLHSAFARIRGRVRIQGFAGVGPGDLIELTGAGDRFNGTALVSGVRHQIDSRNWETDVSFGLSPETYAGSHSRIVEAGAGGLLPGVSGLQIGQVTALEGDPDGEHRVKVRVPQIDPGEEGTWARVATLDAGDNRGSFFRPEIGDEVVLGFLNDDPRHPVLLGMLNSSARPAPITASDDNHEKGLVTRSQIKLLVDDDKKCLTLQTPNGNTAILSDQDGGITLEDENGNRLVLDAGGITIESAAGVTIKASGDVSIEGANISSTASAQLKAEGSAGAEISSPASTVVKGSIVQIN
jgi:Rhs element Vgr protein